MFEEQIEYFHGNKQEIENEKNRKREQMSYFPKMLGTIDRTRYVLRDDDKPIPLITALLTKEPKHNIRGILDNRSEKPKKMRVCKLRHRA